MTQQEALDAVNVKAAELDDTLEAMNEDKPDLVNLTATAREQSAQLTAAIDELARVVRTEPGESLS